MPGRLIERIWPADLSGQTPARYRKACRYHEFHPVPLRALQLALPAPIAGAVSEAEHALQTLNASAHPALEPMARLLLRTESIASSRIEGMQVGVRELARAEARAVAGAPPGPNATEILANIDAMRVAIEQAATVGAIDERIVVAIHRRLLERSPIQHIAGRIRREQNWIGGNDFTPCGADFVPPGPERVPALMMDLYDACNDELLPPIVQAALVHAQFETIHPFADGNGRAGRALVHVVLRRRGIAPRVVMPISVVFANARKRYVAGLTAFRFDGDDGVIAWIEQFANASWQATRLARTYLDAVDGLRSAWIARLRDRASGQRRLRADAAVWAVLDALPALPVCSAGALVERTGRDPSRIYDAIQTLEEAGILMPLGDARRNRVWEVQGLLDLVGGLEAGTSALPA